MRCDRKARCCERTFVPLVLSFARTIHRFQGLSAGETDENQIPNVFKRIVCDPGDRQFEGLCPGTLYTAVSRATTLGDKDGVGSAFYFLERKISVDRIKFVRYKTNSNEQYKGVLKREKWISRLERGTKNNVLTSDEVRDILFWAESSQFDRRVLRNRCEQYSIAFHQTMT